MGRGASWEARQNPEKYDYATKPIKSRITLEGAVKGVEMVQMLKSSKDFELFKRAILVPSVQSLKIEKPN